MLQQSLPSPIGTLTITEQDGAITAIDWGNAKNEADTPLLTNARLQLKEYFSGDRSEFDLPLSPSGTEFQRAVWAAMCEISYGRTRTYGELARSIDSGPRAVGMACGRNPIPIVIPCHRVVGPNGALTGFSGGKGIETKQHLLDLEQPTLF